MDPVLLPHNVMYLVLTVISHIMAGVFLAKPRFNKILTAAIWISFAGIFAFLTAFTPDGTYFITVALHFVLFFTTTQGNAQEKGFLFFIYVCIYTCFSTLYVCLNFALENKIALIAIAVIIMIVMQILLYQVLLRAFRQVTPYVRQNWVGYYFVIIVFFVLIVVQSLFPALSPFTVKETVVFIITVIAFFVACTAIFYSMNNMVNLEQEKRKQIQTEFLLAQVDAQTNEVEIARRNRHDMRHHNNILLEYARNKDIDSIIDYLEKQINDIDTSSPIRFCENDTINNILRIYQTKAENNGIKITIRAAIQHQLDVDYPDIVAIISNVLENALHGAQASGATELWISVHIYRKEERLIFSTKNSCSSDLQFDEIPLNMQGIGIKSIITSADKYNGNCHFAAQNGIFECLIIMDAIIDK